MVVDFFGVFGVLYFFWFFLFKKKKKKSGKENKVVSKIHGKVREGGQTTLRVFWDHTVESKGISSSPLVGQAPKSRSPSTPTREILR